MKLQEECKRKSVVCFIIHISLKFRYLHFTEHNTEAVHSDISVVGSTR